MKKVILPTGDFDVVILETGSRLMVNKPKHLMQEVKFSNEHASKGVIVEVNSTEKNVVGDHTGDTMVLKKKHPRKLKPWEKLNKYKAFFNHGRN